MQDLKRVCWRYTLGVLIIDEIQFLRKQKANVNKTLNFFVHLTNELGIPIVFVGNYDAYNLIFDDLKQTRRTVGTGLVEFKNLDKTSYVSFVNSFWKYQWTKQITDLTDGIINALYKCTAGVPALTINLFKEVQKSVIYNGKEKITISAIISVFNKSLFPYLKFADALNSDKFEEYKDYEDIVIQKQLQLRETIKQKMKTSKLKLTNEQTKQEIITHLKEMELTPEQCSNLDLTRLIYAHMDLTLPQLKKLVTVEVLKSINNEDGILTKSEKKAKKEAVKEKIKELDDQKKKFD